MGGKAKIKIDVVPHKFDCQPNRKRQGTTTVLRPAAMKRRRQQVIQEILSESSKNLEIGNFQEPTIDAVSANTVENIEADFTPLNVTPDQKVTVETQTDINNRTVAVQVNSRPKYRSVFVQCKILSIGIDESCSPIKTGNISTATSSIKPLHQKLLPNLLEDTQKSSSSSSFTHSNSSQDIYEPSENTGSSTMDSSSLQSPVKKSQILKVTNYLINNNLKAYTGVPQEWNMMLERISVISDINITNIKLSLMKIRCQDTFERLSEQFGMSVSNASIIFNKTVPVLAHLLKKLVYVPESSNIKKILPIPFRTSYNHVIAIIDAFEIQIEKPSDPEYQSLTWSEYKKCNTLKYLISCTPDGFINFISKGFGGRISDELLFQESGLLEELPEACAVMADRGFKNIVPLLDDKNIELIRPPSVNSGVKLSQSDVLQGKRIAALRIHIERVIGRIREFDFLKPHAVVNHNMLPLTDNIVVIAAALVNLQAPIIST